MIQGRHGDIAIVMLLLFCFKDAASMVVAIRRMHAAAQEVRRGVSTSGLKRVEEA
jgi:hypothetical protein